MIEIRVEDDGAFVRGISGAMVAACEPEDLRRGKDIFSGVTEVGELKRGAGGLDVIVTVVEKPVASDAPKSVPSAESSAAM